MLTKIPMGFLFLGIMSVTCSSNLRKIDSFGKKEKLCNEEIIIQPEAKRMKLNSELSELSYIDNESSDCIIIYEKREESILLKENTISNKISNVVMSPFGSEKFQSFLKDANFIASNSFCTLMFYIRILKIFKIRGIEKHKFHDDLFYGDSLSYLDSPIKNITKIEKKFFMIRYKDQLTDESFLELDFKITFLTFFKKIKNICDIASSVLTKDLITRVYLPSYQFINYPLSESNTYFLFKAVIVFIKRHFNPGAIARFHKSVLYKRPVKIDEKYLIDFTVLLYLIFVKNPSPEEYQSIENHFEMLRLKFSPVIIQRIDIFKNILWKITEIFSTLNEDVFSEEFMREIFDVIQSTAIND